MIPELISRVAEPAPAPRSLDQAVCQRLTQVVARIGDRWTMPVVMILGSGPRRFNEIKREAEGVSQRMLTLTLRNLERDGLVSRAVTPGAPPRVDYELTALGRSMLPVVQALGAWAQGHMGEIEAARERFDGGAG